MKRKCRLENVRWDLLAGRQKNSGLWKEGVKLEVQRGDCEGVNGSI
jgi:hypothetical protein